MVSWFFLAAAFVAYLISRRKRNRQQSRPPRGIEHADTAREKRSPAPELPPEETVAERQLNAVRSNQFYRRTLMNKSEYVVFCKLEKLLLTSHRGYRVFSQVSLGEILGSDDREAYLAINSKRADFVIIDWSGQPVVVVEYHGSGHFQGDAVTRDTIKREACSKAGIAFIELFEQYTQADFLAISSSITARAA